MLLALLLAAGLTDWVPARWISSDPQSLDLLKETPINCVLLEERHWSADLAAEAAGRGIVTLGVIRPATDPAEAARRARERKLTGVVAEGEFESAAVEAIRRALAGSGLAVIELPPRSRMKLDGGETLLGTYQGLWPGIHVAEDGSAKAAPTGAPWIDTNSGFLRFLRSVTKATLWVGNLPPPKTVIPVARYLQSIGDAAMMGARWIVALDDDFGRRLLAREETALKDWRRMAAHLKYFEEHKEWRGLEPQGGLAVVQDAASGALYSGCVLDMIGARHTPVRPVPPAKLNDEVLEGVQIAVSVDPAALTVEHKETLRRFTRGGGTLLSGPPQWKFSPQRPDQMTLDKKDVDILDGMWRGVNSLTGRRNLGVRLFNVASMLSSLLGERGDKRLVLHLVNYSDYPVESITAHFQGTFRRAWLHSPEGAAKELAVFEVDGGTGVEIGKVGVVATLVVE